jgi:hypothetical protein
LTEPGPLFLLTTHRSGGTLLARIFNAHPDIVIWGEHAGLLNNLAEMAEIIRRHPAVAGPVAERKLDEFLAGKQTNTGFSPWTNPVDPALFHAWARDLITGFFSHGLQPHQRWGVKEIRYHTPEVANFILTLFPAARFVILRRDLVQQCVSNIMAEWSLKHLALMQGDVSEAEALRVIDDCAYALVAIDTGLNKIAATLPDCARVVAYEALGQGEDVIAGLYEFAGLAVTPELLAAANRMLGVRSGATTKVKTQGFLTTELIAAQAPASIAAARRAVAAQGIDISRLRAKRGPGRYSFLVGDNEVRNTNFSTIF